MIFIIFFTILISQTQNCISEKSIFERSIYEIGDTLSIEDQNVLFPVCNGSGNYQTGDNFSFADFNGNINGEYKISIISMNATW
tara:strand:- start:750 stop:1001 length:252 start_codon:yes stop_codon:yes gene_type:complete